MGLFGAPILFYLIGTLIVKIRGERIHKNINEMQREHNRQVKSMQKEHARLRKSLHRKVNKMRNIVAKEKEVKA